MAASCAECAGKGFTREPTVRGTTLIERCRRCGGSGGWNEIDGNVTGFWGATAPAIPIKEKAVSHG